MRDLRQHASCTVSKFLRASGKEIVCKQANQSNLTVRSRPRILGNMQSSSAPNPKTGATAPTAPAVDNRRERRLNVAVPIKVFLEPQSTDGVACCTFEISMVGARLMRFQGVTQVGQIVWLQRHNRRAKYKVIWIGQKGTTQEGQVGVEVLEPANIIWENELRMRIQQSDAVPFSARP